MYKKVENKICPHCGYCEHCGRAGYITYPGYPYPYWQVPTQPYWSTSGGSITVTSTSNNTGQMLPNGVNHSVI